MDRAAAELQRRRERAKLSQKKFRTRQAALLRELQEENARLKAIVHSQRQPALPSAFHQAAVEVAGPTSEFPSTSDWGTEQSLQSATHTGASQSSASEKHGDPAPQPWPVDLTPAAYYQPLSVERPRATQSCMTFRLDCGLLGSFTDHNRVILEPPADIKPYLGPNRHTLAAQIFWYCQETSLALLHQLGGQQPGRAVLIAQNHPVFVSMLRYTSAICSYHYIAAVTEARLEFDRIGYCRADNPAATTSFSTMIRDRVQQMHLEELRVSEEWLCPTQVAQAVQKTLNGQELESAASPLRKSLEGFIHQLWLESTCFGDGPKWRASCVRTLLGWLARNLQPGEGFPGSTATR